MEYVVDLEAFHGPLDLLLYLIEKNEIDIYDIPVAAITDQYMEHLRLTGDYNLDILGDFLIMASYLLNLKSRMLLPRPQQENEEAEEAGDPREELVQKLIDYRRYKQAAEFLAERDNGKEKRLFFRDCVYEWDEPEEIIASINALTRAYHSICRREQEVRSYDVPFTDIDIGTKMEEIMHLLGRLGRSLTFEELLISEERREQLAIFIALLELVRQQKVSVQQENEFGEILLNLRVG
ncbi:MAG TPA: segregation/condensation protein A [Syntrophomonadaceae bacterium]|nr:segregation/condensation protein A [Syntrophomonadaceae bacterium]